MRTPRARNTPGLADACFWQAFPVTYGLKRAENFLGSIMGLVKRMSGLRSRWSRTFPPNLARLMLLACAALWGLSYMLAKFAMETIPPQWLIGLRMMGACACMLALFHKHIIPYLTAKIIVPALVVGLTYWVTMITQTIGLQTIEPGRSAFLTAAYCVFTPFAAWIVTKTKPRAINLIAGVICLTGVGFVSLKPGGALSLSTGDWLTLATAIVFSFNLTCLGIYTKRFDPIAVTFVQFAVAGVLFLIGAIFTEPAPNADWLAPSVLASVLYLFLGATMCAQLMQNIGLAHVPASQASIIMCTESLFAVGFSAMFWGEQILWSSLIGFALIFSAVLMSVFKPGRHSLHRN
jgi:drug/metabolite transporter (DMT)-like permease